MPLKKYMQIIAGITIASNIKNQRKSYTNNTINTAILIQFLKRRSAFHASKSEKICEVPESGNTILYAIKKSNAVAISTSGY